MFVLKKNKIKKMRKLLSILSFMPLLVWAQEIAKSDLHKRNKHENNPGIIWIENLTWEQIKEKAKVENKFIFVDAYATWCAPCKLMDKEVFPDRAVGEFLNERFICVKVQMDETEKDNENIKSWYADSRYIKNTYKPDSYPCFLFFAPDASLAHKGAGLQRPEKFIALAKEALTNPYNRYEGEIEKFKNGQLEISAMPDLARLAKKNNNKNIANKIANEYKLRYLDQLSDKDAFSKDNLLFVADFFYSLLKTNDRYFNFFYHHRDKAEEVINKPNENISDWIVSITIKKEEITNKLYKDGKPIANSNPKWKKIRRSIIRRFGEAYAKKYFPDEQIYFYRSKSNWREYVKYVNKKIEIRVPRAGGHMFGESFGDTWALNGYAWELFKYCDSKKLLKDALKWSEMSIKLILEEKKDSTSAVQYLDTKANLLYRIGRKREAIDLEQKVIAILPHESSFRKEYLRVLEKMNKDMPTWPTMKE
jgi:thioredoxin-related protein